MMLQDEDTLANGSFQQAGEPDRPADAGHSPRRRKRLASHMRACVLWSLALFVATQVAVQIITQISCPYLRDPEFGYKLNRLSEQIAEEPDRPLLVLLGTSRTGQGVRPGVMPDLRTADGRKPFVYNFSQVGSGALAELVTLHRLLDAGIRPNWVAVEILPALLGRPIDVFDSSSGTCRLNWNDVRLLCRYVDDSFELKRRWLRDQLAPCFAHRFSFMNHYASDSMPWRLRLDHWKHLDRWGWSDIGTDSQPLVLVPSALEVTRMTYFEDLQHLQIAPMQDHAMRDLIALCRKEGIPALFYLMPEGSLFRSWYAPAVNACINGYLTGLSKELGVPIVDLRTWMEDLYFGDSHHLYRKGASLFSQRFAPEVLGRLVQGKTASLPNLMAPLTDPYPEQQDRVPLMTLQKTPGQPNSPTLSIESKARLPARDGAEPK